MSRRTLLFGAGAAGIAVAGGIAAWVAGSHTAADTPSSNPGRLAGTGRPGAAGSGPGTGGSGPASTAWTFTTGNEILASPGVAVGVVCVGSKDNYLYAVNAANGGRSGKPGSSGYRRLPRS